MINSNLIPLGSIKKNAFASLESEKTHFIPRNAYEIINNYYSKEQKKLLSKIRVEMISDPLKCESLWKEFSSESCIFDSWDFRKSFSDAYKYKLNFVLLKNDKEHLGLLPLWFEENDFWSKEKFYCFMGGYFNENNYFRVKNEKLIPLLLLVAPTPLWLDAIMIDPKSRFIDDFQLENDDPKYVLNLVDFSSIDDYLAMLKKKKRYNLKRDKKLIESLKPVIVYDDFSNFKYLVRMSKKRFEKVGSDLMDPRKIIAFENVIKNSGKEYDLKMLMILIKNNVAACDLIGMYKNTYSPLRGAYDIEKYPGIGNYMNLLEIEDAIKGGYKDMDFLQTDCNWKKSMNFEEIPLFKYRSK